MIYLITILCYCIAFLFLWKNPDSAISKILFYSISAIPVWLFCSKYTRNRKRVNLTKKEKSLNILQICVFLVLGLSTIILTLTHYNKEYPIFVNIIFILFIISTILLIIWNYYIGKKYTVKTWNELIQKSGAYHSPLFCLSNPW